MDLRGLATRHPDGRVYECAHRVRQRDGAYRWYLSRAVPAKDAQGRVVKWYGTATDIHDLKAAQAQIEALNERLRRAMAETHHRVKNNLQTISGMVELQLPDAGDMVPVDSLVRIAHA